MNRQFHVIAGPYRIARRYARQQGWTEDDFVIVTRGHQLAELDPALIARIVFVRLHEMGRRIIDEIHHEVALLKALWPVPMVTA